MQPSQLTTASQGRVLASQYGEIVYDALSPGNTLLVQALPGLIEGAERVLASTAFQRRHTLIRVNAVRSKSAKGQWHYAVLLFVGPSDRDVLTLIGQSRRADAATVMRAYLHFYDQRGGGIESSFGQGKSGLGLTKRHKKRFQAQRFLMLLGTLAHNLVIWSRRWLAQVSPQAAQRLQHYGIKRTIRDLSPISPLSYPMLPVLASRAFLSPLRFPNRKYREGTTNRFSTVEVTRPPRITIAMGYSIS
jgi:hypothetical protein